MKCFRWPKILVLAIASGIILTRDPIAEAQVVQLPSTRSLSYSGSVSVPDGGTAALGGGSSSVYGSRRNGWGPFSSQSSASGVGGSSLTASVTIIDLSAMDEAILGSAASVAGQAGNSANPDTSTMASRNSPTSERSAVGLKTHATTLAENSSERVGADPGKWQRVLSGESARASSNPTLLESDIRYHLLRGEAAEKAGSLIAARVYYKMARDLMTPELVERYQRILAEREAAEEVRLKAELEFARRKF